MDLAAAAETNAFTRLMLRHADSGASRVEPLVTADGTPYLAFAFEQIEAGYGSVQAFLAQELGVEGMASEKLKHHYLE